jgi:energy-coupling factor transporter ATPase
VINFKNVDFSYDGTKKVLSDLTFSISEGEYVAVIGHNGSGKSTLARLLNALNLPTSGEVLINGKLTSDKKNLRAVRESVGVVFQNPDNQLVASIVEDDVAFGPENLGILRKEIAERIDYALSAVNMQAFRRSSPERLSGGQKQRVAIAGVLALKPKILVLDESTSMLDPEGREDVLSAVNKLNKDEKVTVVSITHYMEEVVFADRVIILNQGKIVFDGTPEQAFLLKELKDYGLELPLSLYVEKKLNEKGIKLNSLATSGEKLMEEICALIQKN